MPQPLPLPLPIFVYGTLKQGQCRASRWPHRAESVEAAVLRGALYDLGPYPAVTSGGDLVLGELWTIAPEHLEHTLRVLDKIECFGVADVDLYLRIVAPVIRSDGSCVSAYTYVIARPEELRPEQRVSPNPQGYCEWTGRPLP